MSAIGPKQTSPSALHMSAFRGKADIPPWECLLLRSLLGVKRTWAVALHMSAFDPKRTSACGAKSVANDPKQRVRLVTAAVQAFTLRATGAAQTIISGQHDPNGSVASSQER